MAQLNVFGEVLMSLDALHNRIRKMKCPLILLIEPRPGQSAAEAGEYCRRMAAAAAAVVPGVTLRAAGFFALGTEGVAEYAAALAFAREQGLYVVADARLNETGDAGEAMAAAFLENGTYPCDAVTVDGYLGSQAYAPLLERLEPLDREIIVLARRDVRSALEFQDIIAGDRTIYRVAADLAARMGDGRRAECGFSRVMISVGMKYMSDLYGLRQRMERVFFYLTGGESRQIFDDFRPAFDRCGWGAVIEVGGALGSLWAGSGFDDPDTLAEEIARLKEELRKSIQVY